MSAISDASPLAERAARGLRKSEWVKTYGEHRYVSPGKHCFRWRL